MPHRSSDFTSYRTIDADATMMDADDVTIHVAVIRHYR
jgi:hypothetical protein